MELISNEEKKYRGSGTFLSVSNSSALKSGFCCYDKTMDGNTSHRANLQRIRATKLINFSSIQGASSVSSKWMFGFNWIFFFFLSNIGDINLYVRDAMVICSSHPLGNETTFQKRQVQRSRPPLPLPPLSKPQLRRMANIMHDLFILSYMYSYAALICLQQSRISLTGY